MQQALRLGRRGLGRTAPNPAVGCVIAGRDGRYAGGGHTQAGGRPHAETEALAQAGERARGGTAYVTLEPCAHTGKTAPCAQALIDAGVARVVYALGDPDPRVNGGGAAMLEAAGHAVDSGLCADAAQHDQLGFLLTIKQARPLVTLKLAFSADGFMRTPDGASPWITGPLARRAGHMLRAQHDAILTGSGTLAEDDPSLDCRLPGLKQASPVPVIMSRSSLPDCRLAARPEALLLTDAAHAALQKDIGFAGTIAALPEVTPAAVLAELAARGMTRLLLECGPVLAAAFLAEGLVDRLAAFSAPHHVDTGGESDISRMRLDFAAFEEFDSRKLGDDMLRQYRRKGGSI